MSDEIKGKIGEDEVQDTYPIVGVGASAGGLQAFEILLKNLPDDPGMAFVLIQHLDPHHESELAEILQTQTNMPVTQANNLERINPNSVYVIPPGQTLSINDGILHLSEPEEPRGQRAPIDLFFRSLAEDQGDKAVCLILSGTGSDGTLGLKRIKERGGVVLVQSPEEAVYDGMPRHAINTKLVDLVAPVNELAQRLVDYHKSADRIQFSAEKGNLDEEEAVTLQRIFTYLHSETGADFSHYKRSTFLRRLQRRMQMNQIDSLYSYLEFLRGNREEAHFLLKDLLISVTNFFRDEEAWEVLQAEVIPKIFDMKGSSQPIRVWVPGCATGEEAYSLAILILEEAAKQNVMPEVQIFATDLDMEALVFARRGLYPEAIAADVSQERLEQFFEWQGNAFQVRPKLKELILFAPHNLIKDAPFAHLDLISCRNLLIYIERDIQQIIFQIFRYSLGENGYLLLGGSESAEQARELFEPVNERERIYRTRPGKQPLPRLPVTKLSGSQNSFPLVDNNVPIRPARIIPETLGMLHRDLILQRYGPPSVLVDRDYQIRFKFGDVGRYLQHQQGEPSLNLLHNVGPQLRVELRTGLYAAFRRQETTKPRNVQIKRNGQEEQVKIYIEPVPPDPERAENLALVVFEEVKEPGIIRVDKPDESFDPDVVQNLEEELIEMRHRMQTTVEEYETSNEELRSSNEELQSMNEELRSTMEELETSREELRSTNEELSSLNQELKRRVDDLNQANSDLENFIESTDIATMFLDTSLRLKRFTPRVADIFNVISTDIGRPFNHLSHDLNYKGLNQRAKDVLENLTPYEEEVSTNSGRWYLLKMRPYRTINGKIDGIVLTLVDFTDQIRVERLAQRRAAQQSVIAELGLIALQEITLDAFMDIVLERVVKVLGVDFAKVLKWIPEENHFILASGVGWSERVVGNATVDGAANSQAGFTLKSDEPVIVENLSTEERFTASPLLTDHKVVSGMSVVIQGQNRPFGIFGVHTCTRRIFTTQETVFLQGVANLLGSAVEQHQVIEARENLLFQVQSFSDTLEKRVKERTELLEKRSEQLSALASALIVAERRERERISQILHDDLQQMLYASQMQVTLLNSEIDSLESDSLKENVKELDNLYDKAIKVARSLTVELSPPVLEGGGLVEAFGWLATHMENTYHLPVTVIVSDEVDFHNHELYDLLFQITRELLFNVVKHAQADSAQILMEQDDNLCIITIVDEGVGFDLDLLNDPNRKISSFGLNSIRERIALFDGSLTVDSTPGKGTKVKISVPCVYVNNISMEGIE